MGSFWNGLTLNLFFESAFQSLFFVFKILGQLRADKGPATMTPYMGSSVSSFSYTLQFHFFVKASSPSETTDSRIIGCISVFEKTFDFGRLGLVAVDPTLQRGVLGRIILMHGEKYLPEELGVSRIGLNTPHARKNMIRWYERQDYVKAGKTTKLPVERTRPDVSSKIGLVEFLKKEYRLSIYGRVVVMIL